MSVQDRDRSYFCTTGKGIEPFLVEELTKKFGTAQVTHVDGKAFFTTGKGTSVARLLQLKTAERLFVQIVHCPKFNMRRKGGFKYLSSTITSSSDVWSDAVQTWRDKEHSLEPEAKKTKTSDDSSTNTISFRVSLKCSGEHAKNYDYRQLIKAIASPLTQNYKWKVDLANPDIEIYTQLSDEHLVVGIPLCVEPLSIRPYVKYIGLRTTVCYVMVGLAGIEAGAWVLDPMCGSGTILVEAAESWPNTFYVGCDVSTNKAKRTAENITYAHTDNIECIVSNVRNIPFKDETFDRILCDVPFGIQHCQDDDLDGLYARVNQESYRVLKRSGKMVVLTGKANTAMFQKHAQNVGFSVKEVHSLKLGWTFSSIVVLKKE